MVPIRINTMYGQRSIAVVHEVFHRDGIYALIR